LEGNLQPGKYKAEFYADKVPAGTYICYLTLDGTRNYRKIVVAR
jgi:hypothetical protein